MLPTYVTVELAVALAAVFTVPLHTYLAVELAGLFAVLAAAFTVSLYVRARKR